MLETIQNIFDCQNLSQIWNNLYSYTYLFEKKRFKTNYLLFSYIILL